MAIRHTIFGASAGFILSAVFLSALPSMAQPTKIVVHPNGTNQLELTVSPTIDDTMYEVFARSNSPNGFWVRLTQIIGSSNGTVTVKYNLDDAKRWTALRGMTLQTLTNWTFVAGPGGDSDGDGLSDTYEDLVTRSDPFSGDTGNTGVEDGYKDPDGDNWSNMQESSGHTNPLEWDQPPGPSVFSAGIYTNGNAVLTWMHVGGTLPDYFLIERAKTSLRRITNQNRYFRPGLTNRPFYPRPGFSPRNMRPENPFILGSFEPIARVPPKPDTDEYRHQEYRYVETNVDTFLQPRYRISACYTSPFRAIFTHVNARTIRAGTLRVKVLQTTNGYTLTVKTPIPFARYLLMVRDKNNSQWRASGYFETGSNNTPIHLLVDARGLMPGITQRPIAMPDVKFAPEVVKPEFIAGSGEDSDGDGLPDVYEVLVTHTDPVNPDTGNAGILDGYKDPDRDGWSNLEEFRRRTNPLAADHPPSPIELKRPTFVEVLRAVVVKSDLRYEPLVEIRNGNLANYQPLREPLQMVYPALSPLDPNRTRGNFDLRISWRVPEAHPQRLHEYHGP